MKTTLKLSIGLLLLCFAFSISGCSASVSTGTSSRSSKSKPLPPGQAKKVTGEKSAKNMLRDRTKPVPNVCWSLKMLFIKNNQYTYSGRYGHVCYIKNSIKKGKMFASPDWKPCRKIAFPDWKIKHVNYFSVKPGTIRLIREKCCSLTCAVVEDYSVKNRIDNISESSCQNKRNSYNQVSGTVFSDRIPKPPANSCHSYQPKKRQNQFSIISRDLCSPSHSFVFNQQNLKPAGYVYLSFFTIDKIGFDIYLGYLVNDKN